MASTRFDKVHADMTETDRPFACETWALTEMGRLYVRQWRQSSTSIENTPIVLLHDSLGCVELWREFPLRLAQATRHPVVAYDRLGFGRSDPYPDALGMDFIAREARSGFSAVIKSLGFDQFIAFGHSVGGGMAVSIAGAFPARCLAVITEAAQAFVEDRTLAGIRAAKKSFSNADQFDRLRKYHGDKAQWVLDAWINTWLSPSFAQWNLDSELRSARCPILTIHGDQDEFGTLRHPQRIMDIAPGPVVLECLQGCGHVPHREQEQPVLEAVAAFVRTASQ